MIDFLKAHWTDWINDGDCSKSCGTGEQKMKRKCMQGQTEVKKGKRADLCPGEHSKTNDCNPQTCRKYSF